MSKADNVRDYLLYLESIGSHADVMIKVQGGHIKLVESTNKIKPEELPVIIRRDKNPDK